MILDQGRAVGKGLTVGTAHTYLTIRALSEPSILWTVCYQDALCIEEPFGGRNTCLVIELQRFISYRKDAQRH